MSRKSSRQWVSMEELQQIKQKEMNEIKTSKITSVDEVSSPYGQYQTLYHNLTMENGDKINIGKKKQQQVGWEVTYTIEGDPDQHTYVKAKSAKKEDAPQQNGGQQPQQPTQSFKQDPDKARSIEMQVCLKEANQFHAVHGFETGDQHSRRLELCDTAQVMYDKLFGKDV